MVTAVSLTGAEHGSLGASSHADACSIVPPVMLYYPSVVIPPRTCFTWYYALPPLTSRLMPGCSPWAQLVRCHATLQLCQVHVQLHPCYASYRYAWSQLSLALLILSLTLLPHFDMSLISAPCLSNLSQCMLLVSWICLWSMFLSRICLRSLRPANYICLRFVFHVDD